VPPARSTPAQSNPAPARDDAAAEKLGWKLAVQAWTFRDRTAVETIDAAKRLGIKYIEFYPGQKLSPDRPDDTVGPDMSDDARDVLKKKLADAGVRAMNFGVVNPKKDKEQTRKIFKFAKDLGIETITCEPDPGAWATLEECCYEFNINAACHDHPRPSRYWNPQTVLDEVNQRGQRVGACADTGHWKRSGLTPVECLKKLRGRIITLHFKDVKAVGNGTFEDQPWGTGDCDARAMLEELHGQGFHGVISLEYETGSGPELEADAAKCVAFFDQVAADLAKND
jgi:sugar phosphate isomerase/epimerase